MGARVLDAAGWALIALLLAMPLMGLRLQPAGMGLTVQGAWQPVATVAVLVLVFRLAQLSLLPMLARFSLPTPRAQLAQIGRHPLALAVLLAAAAAWPFFASRGAVDLATLALIYVMLGLGLNIVVGLAGLLDLGYVAFYAIGAYGFALLAEHAGIGFWLALPLCGLLAAIAGVLLGFPVLRLRGDYLAIVTLGFGEIIYLLLNNLDALTGGPNGIGGIPRPTLFGLEFASRAEGPTFHEFFGISFNSSHRIIFLYLLALLLVVITLAVIRRLRMMPIGRAWEALREDEIACRALGLNPTSIKLSAFALGATFAGFAGCFFAARQGFISPESFTFHESAIILVIVILGGMGSQAGIVLAAVFMTLLPELAREFDQYRMLLFGLGMVLMMIWRPQGLLPARRPRLELA
ncbi:MAG TPA: high-affinity branched-chain amino acid ABC transporter permease LivM [Gammaproteobacteria bacterium]|nr:high-affinity branched-chain amino acid ABC transporter permease LivM [Gammaproteobacteria bacterium]